jgi:stage III sporulation protein AA
MLDFLPKNVKEGVEKVNQTHLFEIRLRADCPVMVNYQGEYRYLSVYGLTNLKDKAIKPTLADIEECVFKAGQYSVYSVEEQLKQGFLTAKNGERIGISGEYVFENGQPHALRSFTSLCIRVPHEVIGCAGSIYEQCMSDRVHNLLIISPPGMGKTTLLRDLSRILSEKTRKNILICDERGEISMGNFGDTCDVIRYCDKKVAFTAGIRAMRPEIIMTDEVTVEDLEYLNKARNAGVTVIASAHFSGEEYLDTPFKRLFEKIVLLDSQKIGKIKAIYNGYD